jgi:hypothetical protein
MAYPWRTVSHKQRVTACGAEWYDKNVPTTSHRSDCRSVLGQEIGKLCCDGCEPRQSVSTLRVFEEGYSQKLWRLKNNGFFLELKVSHNFHGKPQYFHNPLEIIHHWRLWMTMGLPWVTDSPSTPADQNPHQDMDSIKQGWWESWRIPRGYGISGLERAF